MSPQCPARILTAEGEYLYCIEEGPVHRLKHRAIRSPRRGEEWEIPESVVHSDSTPEQARQFDDVLSRARKKQPAKRQKARSPEYERGYSAGYQAGRRGFIALSKRLTQEPASRGA